MVPPGDERCARRRTERSRVHARVAKPILRDAIERRSRDNAAEGSRRAEPNVVGHDEKDVRRLLGWHNARRPPCFRLKGVILDHAAEFRIGCRQLFATDRCGRTGRSRRAGDLDLLSLNRGGCDNKCTNRDAIEKNSAEYFHWSYLVGLLIDGRNLAVPAVTRL